MSGDYPHSHTINESHVYQIRVQGMLDERWSGWFNGLVVRLESEDPLITLLSGLIVDQASLRGILNRIWNLNLNLISVNRVDDGAPLSAQPPVNHAADRR